MAPLSTLPPQFLYTSNLEAKVLGFVLVAAQLLRNLEALRQVRHRLRRVSQGVVDAAQRRIGEGLCNLSGCEELETNVKQNKVDTFVNLQLHHFPPSNG